MPETAETTATITILDPRVVPPRDPETETFSVGGPIAGKVVGLRLDTAWRSYIAVVDEWEQMLTADGAIPKILWAGERVGPEAEVTRADLDEWSRLIDIGVVGLGN
ncbi:MAG: hypothetical protein WDA60_15880 [Acidimicrobiia bacterium]